MISGKHLYKIVILALLLYISSLFYGQKIDDLRSEANEQKMGKPLFKEFASSNPKQKMNTRLNKTLCHKLVKSNLAYFCIGYSAICDQVDGVYAEEKAKDEKLCNLLNRLGSDKCIQHDYAYLYDFLFKNIRHERLNILELGLGSVEDKRFPSQMMAKYTTGASHRAWREYFPNSQIFGADVNPDSVFQEERITTYYADITKNDTLNRMFHQIVVPLDILIDDSLHRPGAQKNLFSVAFHKVKPGGLYIVEDIGKTVLCEEHYQHYIDIGLKDFAFIRTNKVGDSIVSVAVKASL